MGKNICCLLFELHEETADKHTLIRQMADQLIADEFESFDPLATLGVASYDKSISKASSQAIQNASRANPDLARSSLIKGICHGRQAVRECAIPVYLEIGSTEAGENKLLKQLGIINPRGSWYGALEAMCRLSPNYRISNSKMLKVLFELLEGKAHRDSEKMLAKAISQFPTEQVYPELERLTQFSTPLEANKAMDLCLSADWPPSQKMIPVVLQFAEQPIYTTEFIPMGYYAKKKCAKTKRTFQNLTFPTMRRDGNQ